MNKLLRCTAAFALVLCLLFTGFAFAEEEPIPAPDFPIYTEAAEEYSFSDFLGKPILMNIWATWCPPCQAELPLFNEAFARYGEKINFIMLSVDSDEDYVGTVKEFLADNGYTFDVWYDPYGYSLYSYGVNSIPVTILVAPDGTFLGGQVSMLNETVFNDYLKVLLSYIQ